MRYVPAVLLSVALASGCGLTAAQQEAARRFSRAAAEVGTFAAAELPRMRETTIALNTASVAIRGEAKRADLDGPFDANKMTPREAAADALATYGRLLLALVDETQAEQLQAAADEFVASAQAATGRQLSDEQLQAAGELVTAVGRRIVEYKKARAVKAIVARYKGVIDDVCDLLRADFAVTGQNLAQGLHVAIVRVQSDADIALADRHASHAERAVATDGLHLAEEARGRVEVVYANAVAALDALKKANAQLGAALEDDRLGLEDVRSFAVEARELAASAKALGGK